MVEKSAEEVPMENLTISARDYNDLELLLRRIKNNFFKHRNENGNICEGAYISKSMKKKIRKFIAKLDELKKEV